MKLDTTIGYWHMLPVNPIATPGQCLVRVASLPNGDLFGQRFAPCEDWELWLRLHAGDASSESNIVRS